MKLFIIEMTDYWERVSLPVVAESTEQALEKADLIAYEILDGSMHDCKATEVTEVDDYKVVLVDENELKDKKPWKPKWGEKFYSIYWYFDTDDNKWNIEVACNILSPHNIGTTMYADMGNCFKTKKEAEANKFAIYKRLTGKEW